MLANSLCKHLILIMGIVIRAYIIKSLLSIYQCGRSHSNGRKFYICGDHCLHGLTPMPPTYFVPHYLKQVNFPRVCVGDCNKRLVASKKGMSKKEQGECKLVSNLGAMACHNALNHRDDKCVIMYCMDCYGKELDKQPPGSTRKSRRSAAKVGKGEMRMPNGRIVALED